MTYIAERPREAVAGESSRLASQLRRVLLAVALIDAFALAVAGLGSHVAAEVLTDLLPAGPVVDVSDAAAAPVICGVWILTLLVRGAYRRRILGAGHEEFQIVVSSTLVAAGLIGTGAFLLDLHLERAFVALFLVSGCTALLASRYAMRKVVHVARRNGQLLTRVIAVCEPGALDELISQFLRTPQLGYQVVGTCVPGLEREADVSLPVPLFGGIDSILEACEITGAHTVLVGSGGASTSRALRQIGWALEGRNIGLVVVPSVLDVAGPRVHMRHLAGLPLVHIEEPGARRAGGLAKRAFDLVGATAMLLVLSPLIALIALAVKLNDGGPVFFRQERAGRHGQSFRMTKFRSMVVNADEKLADLSDFNDVDDVLFKMRNDPRVTRVGRPLRKWSLDELPQLFDVLRGDMSLVGPRPPLQREVDLYPPEMHRRMLVRPGLTGLWQISGRSDLPFDEAVRMDLYYVDNWSIVSDVIIMLKTLRAVVLRHGAY